MLQFSIHSSSWAVAFASKRFGILGLNSPDYIRWPIMMVFFTMIFEIKFDTKRGTKMNDERVEVGVCAW